MQFLALKGFINKIQFFLKIPYILKFLHKPLHNDIKKIIKKIEENFELKKEYSKKHSCKTKWVWFMLSCLHPIKKLLTF